MATLRDIKLRIKGVKSTQQITKAMKMVAAAKLRRAQENVINARPYAKKISELLSHLITDEDAANNPFLSSREVKNVALVVVTADRGLCGAFNTNIIRESQRYLKEEIQNQGHNAFIYCVGKKSLDYYKRNEANIIGTKAGVFQSLSYESALEIAMDLIKGYLDQKYDKIVIIYNEFKSIIQQRIVIEDFLPVAVEDDGEHQGAMDQSNFLFEPDQKAIFESLLPKKLKAQVWRVLLESNAAELAARMTAMDNATTNAKEMIRNLQLTFNKERQAAITKELLEVVSGANALREG